MNKSRILVFMALAYGISWICWLPIVKFIPLNLSESPIFVILLLVIGIYSPTISAILGSAIIGGRPAVKDLIKKYILWRVSIVWYIAAILFFPLVYSLSVFAYRISNGSIGSINYGVLPIIPVLVFVSIFLGPLGEESCFLLLDHRLSLLGFILIRMVVYCWQSCFILV